VNLRYKNRFSIFKSNAPLVNIVENLGKLGNDLTKLDHVIIVGGPGNKLGRNYCYSIKEDINFIAERSNKPLQEILKALDEQEGEECECKSRSGALGVWQVPCSYY